MCDTLGQLALPSSSPKPSTPHQPTQQILELARTFPCLRDKLTTYHPARFDADAFFKMIGPWSSGEYLCGLFILNVWNPSYAKTQGWHFHLLDFVGTCGSGAHMDALIDWLNNPIWP